MSCPSSGPPHVAHITVRVETGIGAGVLGAAGWEL
jgi:hypothetical protein